MKEISYVMVKPEFANIAKVVTEVIRRLEDAGIVVQAGAYIRYTKEDAKKHYAAHVEKDFYPYLEKYITSDTAYGMIVEGENAISRIRNIVGSTKNPLPGTIRYDIPQMLGLELRITENVVHASDSAESAKQEIEIFQEILEKKLKAIREKFNSHSI